VIGRRLPVQADGAPTYPTQAGDYCGPVQHNGLPTVFFLKPNARDPDATPVARSVQHVTSPPHTFRECADGSLEIRNSLGDMHAGWESGPVSDGWHGFLDEGHVWRKV
jgi:hypothetical protein